MSAFLATKALCGLLGLTLEPRKESPPAQPMSLLGANVTIAGHVVTAKLATRKRNEYRAALTSILAGNRMAPSIAAKTRGKLGFAQSMCFGRYGRAMLHDLTMRQYATIGKPKYWITSELRESLQWWLSTLGTARPRELPLHFPAPVMVYSDAQGSGHCAAVCFPPDEGPLQVIHTHVPPWMAALPTTECGIFEFEPVAVVLAVLAAIANFPGRPVVICCDNQGSIGAVKKGGCKTPLGRSLMALLWRVAAETATHLWIEYVRSPLSIADAPSR